MGRSIRRAGRILPQKSHTAAGLCGEKMTEQEKSTTIFVPLSYHGNGAAVKRFCGGKQRVRGGAAAKPRRRHALTMIFIKFKGDT